MVLPRLEVEKMIEFNHQFNILNSIHNTRGIELSQPKRELQFTQEGLFFQPFPDFKKGVD
jgi:hypothetical protein